jgi:cyanophycin synthetase
VDVAAVPVTFGGAARYNVENALGATAVACALGISDDAIARGLRAFGQADNPRRGELVENAGVRIMLDYGHNPEGVRAVLSLVASLRGHSATGRLFIVAGSAGDRTNHEIDEMCRTIAAARPHRVLLRELAKYMRGRMPGEMPAILKRSLSSHGLPDDAISLAASEVDALRRILSEAKPDDFVLVLVHLDHDEVRSFLAQP